MSYHGGLRQPDPDPHETQICLPFIERQIDLADPEYLVCLGVRSSRALGRHGGIMRARLVVPLSTSNRPRYPGARHAPPGFLATAASIRDLPGRTCERLRATRNSVSVRTLTTRHTRLSLTSSSASALSISFRVSSNP
jgi:hypothetical protein